MYEIWLMLNIVWETLRTAWPWLLWLLLAVIALGWVALRGRGTGWRAAWPMALAGAVLVGLVALVALPGLTQSSLSEVKYWVDWLALAGLAAGFAVVSLAVLWPLAALLKRSTP